MNQSVDRGEKITFGNQVRGDFYSVLKTRVDEHFKKKGCSRYANASIYLKIAFIFAVYFFSYAMILSNDYSGWALIGWFTLLGFSMGLLGFNFSHDVIHGSFFPYPKLNRMFSYVFDLNGESSYIWRVSHNYQHHTYTNIPGHDEDINKAILMRFSPTDKLYPFHRFQYLYALPLYAFTTLNWAVHSDYQWFFRELKKGSIPRREIYLFFFFKALNLFLFMFLPMMLLSAPWWQIVAGFVFMHFGGGTFTALVFQLAHLVEGVEFPTTDAEGKIERPWAEHELRTTSDFATNSSFWAYWLGGLNYQVTHHLFPYVCHVHYPDICPILRKTAEEFGIPYHSLPSFSGAVKSHLRILKRFGREASV